MWGTIRAYTKEMKTGEQKYYLRDKRSLFLEKAGSQLPGSLDASGTHLGDGAIHSTPISTTASRERCREWGHRGHRRGQV